MFLEAPSIIIRFKLWNPHPGLLTWKVSNIVKVTYLISRCWNINLMVLFSKSSSNRSIELHPIWTQRTEPEASVFSSALLGWFGWFFWNLSFQSVQCSIDLQTYGCWGVVPEMHFFQSRNVLHPWKLTCPQKRDYFNRKYIFQPSFFRGYVSFQEMCYLFLTKRLDKTKEELESYTTNFEKEKSSYQNKRKNHQKMIIYRDLEPNWSLFLKVNPPKQGLFQSKQGSFGF